MGLETGIAFAIGAIVFWGFGDFLIQRTTRKLGDWETLFVVTLFGVIILFPFIYNDLQAAAGFHDSTFLILVGMSVVLFAAALLDFEALKKGKLAIVEPIMALEVPVTAIITFVAINEGMNALQIFLISTLVLGLVLVSAKKHHFRRQAWLERGAIVAMAGSLFMGLANFMVGFSSRITSPLFANWFLNVFIAAISLFYLMSEHKLGKLSRDFAANRKLVLSTCFLDNLAWVFIAIAATIIPIAIAFALSESYIALAALLGIIINKELLQRHQKAGLAIALGSAVVLSFITI